MYAADATILVNVVNKNKLVNVCLSSMAELYLLMSGAQSISARELKSISICLPAWTATKKDISPIRSWART